MQRRIILTSSLTDPEKLKYLLSGDEVWVYAGENVGRFKKFKDAFDKKLINLPLQQYHDFINSKRKNFVEWTETVHNQYGNSLVHWLSDTFSSNPYMSKLFLHSINLAWFQNILNVYSDKDIIFISESHAVLRAAEKIISSCDMSKIYKIGFYKEKICFLCKLIANTLKGYAILLIFTIRWLVVFSSPNKQNNTEIQNLSVIIDTYLFENSFDKNSRFKNKYFAEIHDFFNKMGVSIAVYPIFHRVSFKNFIASLKNIRLSGIKFVLLEDYLKILDYFDVLITMFKRFKYFEKVQYFLGIDIQSVVDEENWVRGCSPSFVMAMIMHKLPKRLCNRGLSLKLYINWSENQTTHRALIHGLHRYFPNIEVVGGKPFIPPLNHLNLFTTTTERVYRVSPDRFVTCGKKLKEIFSLYDKGGHYENGASFRYGYLWNAADIANYGHNKALITVFLPYHQGISKYVLFFAYSALCKAMSKDYKVIIKVHPAVQKRELKLLFSEVKLRDSRMELTQEDQISLLQKSAAIVTSASSVTCEAICLGIPAVLIAMPVGLDLNMHDYMPSSMWRMAYSKEDFDTFLNKWALQHPLSFNERREIGKQVLCNFFEPVTDKSVSVYLSDKMKRFFIRNNLESRGLFEE